MLKLLMSFTRKINKTLRMREYSFEEAEIKRFLTLNFLLA